MADNFQQLARAFLGYNGSGKLIEKLGEEEEASVGGDGEKVS
jgi:hypothetical protein